MPRLCLMKTFEIASTWASSSEQAFSALALSLTSGAEAENDQERMQVTFFLRAQFEVQRSAGDAKFRQILIPSNRPVKTLGRECDIFRPCFLPISKYPRRSKRYDY